MLAMQGLTGASPISGIPIAILLGAALKNSGLVPSTALKALAPGLQVALLPPRPLRLHADHACPRAHSDHACRSCHARPRACH